MCGDVQALSSGSHTSLSDHDFVKVGKLEYDEIQHDLRFLTSFDRLLRLLKTSCVCVHPKYAFTNLRPNSASQSSRSCLAALLVVVVFICFHCMKHNESLWGQRSQGSFTFSCFGLRAKFDDPKGHVRGLDLLWWCEFHLVLLIAFLTCGDWHFFSGAGTSRWFYGAELHSSHTWPQVRTSQYGTCFLDKSNRCRAWNRLNGWRMVLWQLQQRPLAFSCALFVSMPLFERLGLTSECACAVNRRTDSFLVFF